MPLPSTTRVYVPPPPPLVHVKQGDVPPPPPVVHVEQVSYQDSRNVKESGAGGAPPAAFHYQGVRAAAAARRTCQTDARAEAQEGAGHRGAQVGGAPPRPAPRAPLHRAPPPGHGGRAVGLARPRPRPAARPALAPPRPPAHAVYQGAQSLTTNQHDAIHGLVRSNQLLEVI
ncbi:unnamed protein product [Plutella xylostella]|uniref:(diamondback moth) hypothetical protein n=1 Tax=Plutella xylostella TaxID=51655 RepID=A0A8S4G251_PLUXY|nr:unnamed protein product [Plutella xylostella]